MNLIGEHTDYTGGLVLPMAIAFTTTARLTSSTADHHFRSDGFATERTLTAADRSEAVGDWSDYPVGVLRELQKLGIAMPPFTLDLSSDVPFGAGLSSSASVEVATAMALLQAAGATLEPEQVALLCQRAENIYVGSPCGIMDQFVVTLAKAGHALLVDTRSLGYDHLPMNTGTLAGCRVVIANSMVRHAIVDGDYGLRRRELEAGQAAILARFPHLRDLGDAGLDELAASKEDLSAESYRRCRHVISENSRVRQAADAMRAGDAEQLGRLISAAHVSERDDFECSVAEIDALVEIALTQPGCLGSRLTGGGFGGCTVSLVLQEAVESFTTALRAAYEDRFGIRCDVYTSEAVNGAVARGAHAG